MKPRLLWLTQGKNPNLPSLRLRVLALQDLLSEQFDQEIFPAPTKLIDMWRVRKLIKAADIVILQKELISIPVLWLLRRYATRLIYDFDDAVYVRLLPGGDCRKSKKRMGRFSAICRACDVAHAGNRILAEAAHTAGAKTIVEIPTAVPDQFAVMETPHSGTRIGWIGTAVNLPYLEAMEPIFSRLAGDGYEFQLQIMSNKKPKFMNFKKWSHTPWSEKEEAAFLKNIDIGIMPLANNEHARGKCAYKALQYMSYGKPVVISDVGINAEWTAGAGRTAKQIDDFYPQLSELLQNPEVCASLGQAGSQIVTARFTRKVAAHAVITSIMNIIP